jgi:RNA polymerase sigma-70 factor (ECF subfamily)
MAELIAVNRTDGELLARTAAGDAEAFGVFYDRFERDMLAFLMRATGRAHLAADLCGEVFAQALSSARGFDPELGTARAWLYGIARHELADAFHRGRVEDRARRRLEIEALALRARGAPPKRPGNASMTSARTTNLTSCAALPGTVL